MGAAVAQSLWGLGYELYDQGLILGRGNNGFFFIFITVFRPTLGPTQPPVQWVLGVKQLGHEVDHSPPSSAEVKNVWNYTSTPPVHLHGMVLN